VVSADKETAMQVKIDRNARRHIEEAGGVLTVEARARTGGCLIRTHLVSHAGKPQEPALFGELEAGGIRIFARGVLERPDGSTQPTRGALPGKIRIRERDGALVAEAA
jgi:hypothetical protein